MFVALGLLVASQGASAPGSAPQVPKVVPPETIEVRVLGTSNPWLAGLGPSSVGGVLEGSTFDQVPGQSPRQVDIRNIERRHFRFLQVQGGVRLRPEETTPAVGPIGNIEGKAVRKLPPLNGISDILAPPGALLGVFLDDDIPTRNYVSPPTLRFGTEEARDASVMHPRLRQVFYIGNGLDGTGGVRSVVAPVRAKRLFLGVMDNSLWRDNSGEFTLTVVSAAE
ncbi:MAG: hypothetical protein ACO1SV_13380 [Fimbriimonas sp.]